MKLTSPALRGAGPRRSRRALTTEPGFRNGRGQVVLASTGARSTTHPNQTIYRLRCDPCGREYGANGADIHERRCPFCQQGSAAEPLREAAPRLDFGDRP